MDNTSEIINTAVQKIAHDFSVIPLKLEISKPKEHVELVVDAERPIDIKTCADINRKLQAELESHTLNFSITVSTYGAFEPFRHKVHFTKNIGRAVWAKLKNGKELSGLLKNADAEIVTLETEERVPKEKGKGKITKRTEHRFSYSEFETIKVKPLF